MRHAYVPDMPPLRQPNVVPEEPPLSTPAAKTAFKRAALTLGAATCGLYGLGAVASWKPGDPSLNTATDIAPQNLFGAPGAILADLAWQAFGIAAPACMAALAGAGLLRVLNKRMLQPVPQARLLAGAGAIALLAGLASHAPRPPNWPLASGPGGLIGDGTKGALDAILSITGIPGPEIFAAILAAAGGAFAFGWAFRMTPKDVAIAADSLGKLAQSLAAKAGAALRPKPNALAIVPPASPIQELDRRLAQAFPSRHMPRLSPDEPAEPALDVPHLAAFDPDADEPQMASPARPGQSPLSAPAPAGPARTRKASAPGPARPQGRGEFRLPSLDLLNPPKPRQIVADGPSLQAASRRLEAVLADFNVQGEIVAANPGPVVTLFELEPAPGVKSARVIGLAEDIARSMSAASARVAVIPGRNAIGIELPNAKRETVYLRSLIASNAFIGNQGGLPLALGETIEGEPFAADLAKMPHLLIAGTTGSGKSVGINAMILSLLYRLTPEQCRFILIDPKMLELSVYEGIPHLLSPVVTEPKKAVVALKWTVREMEERYRCMAKLGVRNITGYNEKVREALARGEQLEKTVQSGFNEETGEPVFQTRTLPMEPMPYIVVVIDEMADLMLTAGKEIESAVQRLAQMARAAGIHVVMATQRPSVNVITGTIKAVLPTRVSYSVTSKIDSRTILGEQGAEQLLGMGDLLFMGVGGRIRRLHGPFVSDEEVDRVVQVLKNQGPPSYRTDVTEERDDGTDRDEDGDLVERMGGGGGAARPSGDELYDRAVAIIQRDRKASTSYLQRRLSIGFNRSASLIERMEKDGYISGSNGAGKRDVLIPPPEDDDE